MTKDELQDKIHNNLAVSPLLGHISTDFFENINERFEGWYSEDDLSGQYTFDIHKENIQGLLGTIGVLESGSKRYLTNSGYVSNFDTRASEMDKDSALGMALKRTKEDIHSFMEKMEKTFGVESSSKQEEAKEKTVDEVFEEENRNDIPAGIDILKDVYQSENGHIYNEIVNNEFIEDYLVVEYQITNAGISTETYFADDPDDERSDQSLFFNVEQLNRLMGLKEYIEEPRESEDVEKVVEKKTVYEKIDGSIEDYELKENETIYEPNTVSMVAFSKDMEVEIAMLIQASCGKAVFAVIDLEDGSMEAPVKMNYMPSNPNPNEDNPEADVAELLFTYEAEGFRVKFEINPDSEDVRSYYEEMYIRDIGDEVKALEKSKKVEEMFYSFKNSPPSLMDDIVLVGREEDISPQQQALSKLYAMQEEASKGNHLKGDSPSVLAMLSYDLTQNLFYQGAKIDKDDPSKITGLESDGITSIYDIPARDEVALIVKKDENGDFVLKTGDYNRDASEYILDQVQNYVNGDISEKSAIVIASGVDATEFENYRSTRNICPEFLDMNNLSEAPLKLSKLETSDSLSVNVNGVAVAIDEGTSAYIDMKDPDVAYILSDKTLASEDNLDVNLIEKIAVDSDVLSYERFTIPESISKKTDFTIVGNDFTENLTPQLDFSSPEPTKERSNDGEGKKAPASIAKPSR